MKSCLNGDGLSYYRQAEVTAKLTWKDGQNMVFTYTRSRAEGTLNTFDTFLGNFPTPLVRPDVYSNLPADLPNRFLTWGRFNFPPSHFPSPADRRVPQRIPLFAVRSISELCRQFPTPPATPTSSPPTRA